MAKCCKQVYLKNSSTAKESGEGFIVMDIMLSLTKIFHGTPRVIHGTPWIFDGTP